MEDNYNLKEKLNEIIRLLNDIQEQQKVLQIHQETLTDLENAIWEELRPKRKRSTKVKDIDDII